MFFLERRGALAGILVLCICLAGCGGGGSSRRSVTPLATATVGPAGGSVASADGSVALTVPPGALAAATEIRITAVTGDAVPAGIRAVAPDRVYRFEPSGTTFATPARLRVELPAAGHISVLAFESAGTVSAPGNLKATMESTRRVVEADMPHFSHAFVKDVTSVTAVMSVDKEQETVGNAVQATFTLEKAASKDTYRFTATGFSTSAFGEGPTDVLAIQSGTSLPDITFRIDEARTLAETRAATCTAQGIALVRFKANLYDFIADALTLGSFDVIFDIEIGALESVRCNPGTPPPASVVSVGLFNIPGLTAPDGINYFAGPVAGLGGTGPYAAVAGAEGVKVVDLVTRQVALDRTSAGPDGATLGTMALGAVPVAQAASAGAPAAMIGYGAQGAFLQNWNGGQWGGTVLTPQTTFDAVTPGNGLVASVMAVVRPVLGIDFLAFDATSSSFRADPSRFAPYSAFPGTSNLVSAQLLDAQAAHMLVLGRASGPGSTATSTKVFHKNANDAQIATTLLSLGSVEARRLRCAPVGAKYACVVGMTGSGQGQAFLFDPASPTDTPAVTTITAAAGTLGVALAVLGNGHVGVVMANFSANSLTVAELSADLATIHSSSTTPAPVGCLSLAHVALLNDSEGVKAVATCNGSGNYWVSRPFD